MLARFSFVFVVVLPLIVACNGSPSSPRPLEVNPLSGPPGTVLKLEGLDLAPGDGFEVWVGEASAPATLRDDGTLAAAVPLYLGADGWPAPPAEPQTVEVRRGGTVLARSRRDVTVTDLPRAPGSSREVQAAFVEITDAYDALFARIPLGSEDQIAIRQGVVAMLRGLISEGENSLEAVLDGDAPLLAGAAADSELIDALLASSGAVAYFRAYADALQGAAARPGGALEGQAVSLLCDGDGEDFDLACQMQIGVVLDDYSRAFVKPTVEGYANTVGLVSGLLAMGTVAVPGSAIIGAILSVADFVMEKVAPALLPAKLSRFELKLPDAQLEVGEATVSQIFVSAVNDPPAIGYLDLFEQIKTLAGLKNIEFSDQFYEVLKATAEFAFDFYLKIVKSYEASHPGSHPWATAGDLRIPAMSWGPVEVKSDRLVTLASSDATVVEPREGELEWQGVKLGEAVVRVTPRGPGEKSKVLRDHALCLGCVYYGGAFGNEVPTAEARVVVGEVVLTATPSAGPAPLAVTFSWTGVEPQAEGVSCILDVGDGSSFIAIADCAHTTSQAYTYPFTSVLESSTHAFEATLKVVGTEKTATAEVRVDWTFRATPTEGAAPLDVGFTWGVPYPADGGTVRGTLDPGDGTPPIAFDDCVATSTAQHSYAKGGSFVATLTLANAITTDSRTAPVSVTEEGSCAGVMDVPAWKGTIVYSHGRDVANDSRHVITHVDVNVSGDLRETYRNASAGVVGFAAETLDGNVAVSWEQHAHGDGYHRVDVTFSGSGAPAAGSRMALNVFSDCRYDFYAIGSVAGSGTFFGDPTEGTKGFNPIRGEFDGASLDIHGSYAFPVYHPSDIEASTDKPIWFAEAYEVAGIMERKDMGTVTVTWTFTPLR